MPWRERCAVELREQFIKDWMREHNVSGLSRRYGISRKTAHKWIRRFHERGQAGLTDRSRRPHVSARATAAPIVEALIALRRRHRSWGAKKLLALLRKRHPRLRLPAQSTVSDLLKRAGLITAP